MACLNILNDMTKKNNVFDTYLLVGYEAYASSRTNSMVNYLVRACEGLILPVQKTI